MSQLESSSTNSVQDCNYLCNVCGEKFKFKNQVTLHSFVHEIKKFECAECHKLYISDHELTKHKRLVHEGRSHKLICDLCSKEFRTYRTFLAHCETHFDSEKEKKGKKDFDCSLCGKSFTSQMILDIHFRAHSGEKPYVCDHCGEEFVCASKYRTHLKIHVPKTTPKPKLYHCTQCPKVFNLKIDLQDHDNYHLNFFPYQCPTCELKFCEFKLMKKHCLIHDNSSFACDICPKKFTDEIALQNHSKAHLTNTLHECKVCRQTFIKKCHVQKHMMSHTKEKPFKCDFCQKQFVCKNNLTLHYRIHTGEKPFSCEICDKSFRLKSILDDHYKTHKA